MKFCPKCGMILNNGSKNCPQCHSVLTIPKNSSSKNSKTKRSSSSKKTKKNPDFIPNPIPLTIKKAEKHKNKKAVNEYIDYNYQTLSKYYDDDLKIFNFSYLIKILIMLALLLITISIIFQTAYNSLKSPKVIDENTANHKLTQPNNLYNEWQSENNSLFVFKKDSTFYWYEDYKNLKDNYYQGTYTFKTSLDALKEMGYTEEEFTRNFSTTADKEHVYSIEITPTKAYINKKDVTKDKIKDNVTWWYILIINKDGTAISYNQTLDQRYTLIKKES